MRFSLSLLLLSVLCLVQFNSAVEHQHTASGAANSTEVASDASDGGYDGAGRLILIQEMYQFSAHARVIRDDDEDNQGFYGRRGRRSPGGKGYAGPSSGNQYKTSPNGGQSYGAGGAGRRY